MSSRSAAWRGARLSTVLALLSVAPLLTSCMKFHLIHPKEVPAQVTTWSESHAAGGLKVQVQWAAPAGPGPFPSVLVHPDAGHQSVHLKGVIWDLASRGYLAAAVDYRRLERGRYRRSLFAWREKSDATRALEILRACPRVDRGRVALLGFSQGGVFSLLIAGQDPQVRAVVAYYPVTDFEDWLTRRRPNPFHRCVFKMIEGHFRRKSGAHTDEEFRALLARASPIRSAGKIHAPVLLIHGEADTTASVGESERMARRLEELGREVQLLVIPGARHVFNFLDAPAATRAWDETLTFLERHLGPKTTPPG